MLPSNVVSSIHTHRVKCAHSIQLNVFIKICCINYTISANENVKVHFSKWVSTTARGSGDGVRERNMQDLFKIIARIQCGYSRHGTNQNFTDQNKCCRYLLSLVSSSLISFRACDGNSTPPRTMEITWKTNILLCKSNGAHNRNTNSNKKLLQIAA